jgi:homoaconitase/3-isopropylmalate dehydratase large subunit
VEHVLATSTLNQKKALNMLVQVDGDLLPGVTSKDIVLHICGVIGTAGGTGASIEVASDGARMASDDRLIASLIRRDDRVCGVGDPLALDGGTHDDLEYGH